MRARLNAVVRVADKGPLRGDWRRSRQKEEECNPRKGRAFPHGGRRSRWKLSKVQGPSSGRLSVDQPRIHPSVRVADTCLSITRQSFARKHSVALGVQQEPFQRLPPPFGGRNSFSWAIS